MKFQLLTAASMVASAAAAPAILARQGNLNSTIPDGVPFSLVAIRSGSSLQYASFSASHNSIFINSNNQDAVCQKPADDASFYLSNGTLNLYTPSNVTQQLYTDRSGMGQGVLQYTTSPGGYGAGRNSETQGWEIDAYGDLTFDGASLIACPLIANSTTGPYVAWVSAGVSNPGGNTDCLGIAVRTVLLYTSNACTYSYTPARS